MVTTGAMTSHQRPIATMDLSRTVTDINGNFSRKSQIFPPHEFCTDAEGVPHGISVLPLGSKN